MNPKAFESLPHVVYRGDERVVQLASLWDGAEWHGWWPHDLTKMKGGEVVEGGYFAKTPERPTDLLIRFCDFMWRHGSWKEVTPALIAIETNIFRLAVSLAKIDALTRQTQTLAEADRLHHADFFSSEVEFLFLRCRSLFDDLQQVIGCLWKRVQLTNQESQRAKKNLPTDSFRKALQRIQESKEAIPYGLPPSIALAYTNAAPFFYAMRDIRDRMVHSGEAPARIYLVDGVPAIEREGTLAKLSLASREANRNLVELRPALSSVIYRTLASFDEFISAFKSVIRFPEPLFPSHSYYLRSPHLWALAAVHDEIVSSTSSTSAVETKSLDTQGA